MMAKAEAICLVINESALALMTGVAEQGDSLARGPSLGWAPLANDAQYEGLKDRWAVRLCGCTAQRIEKTQKCLGSCAFRDAA